METVEKYQSSKLCIKHFGDGKIKFGNWLTYHMKRIANKNEFLVWKSDMKISAKI